MAIGYGVQCQKPAPRVVERAARVSAEKRREQAAKAAVWRRAGSRCEKCGRAVSKGVDSLKRGIVHHEPPRSKGDKSTMWDPKRLVLHCVWCDRERHG
jgi:hypothetical protein